MPRLPGLLATAAILAVACSDPAAVPLTPGDVSPAKGGGSNPTVSAADPSWAPQDTTLDVRVLGTGFDDGSRADWALDGVVDPALVRTNSTRFVSSTELVANITISPTATPVLYDIVVTTRPGKKGIGAEKFEVAPKGSSNPRFTDPSLRMTWTDQASPSGGGITGDHRNGDGSPIGGVTSTYEDGLCGVVARLWTSRWGDATSNPIDARRGCGASRFLIAAFGTALAPGSATLTAVSGGHFTNVHGAGCSGSVSGANLESADPYDCLVDPEWVDPANDPWEPTATNLPAPGAPNRPAQRVLRITLAANSSFCEAIRYSMQSFNGVPGRPVLVTRLASGSWQVTSQPDGSGRHVAFCERAGQLHGAYDIPFRIEFTRK